MDINLLDEKTLSQLKDTLQSAHHILICCHKSPDGDAIGSCLGWAAYLRRCGKEPVVVIPDAMPDFLQWIPGVNMVVRYDKNKEKADQLLQQADLVCCLDFNSAHRLADMQPAFEAAHVNKILIDHHIDPDVPAALLISYPNLCSTSEIVFRLIWQLGGYEGMTEAEAQAIYCGMMTDTGGFTYNSSYPEIYHIIGLLLSKHIDKDRIYRRVYNNFSESCLKMRAYVISQKLCVMSQCHASYFTITKKEQKRFHFIKGDAEGLVNEPLRIKGLRLSISLREDTEKENLVWVSLRSVDHYYCNKLAEKFFNGGGHANASGGRLYCTMDEAVQVVHMAILAFAKQYNEE